MRQRSRRNIATLLVVVVILVAVVSYNSWTWRSELAVAMEAKRAQAATVNPGVASKLLSWDLLRGTTGNLKTGPHFVEALPALDGQEVLMLGFAFPVPYRLAGEDGAAAQASLFPVAWLQSLTQEMRGPTHHAVEDFLLLSLPSACYLGSAPPWNEAVYVHLAEEERLDVRDGEIKIVRGRLRLAQEPGIRFFYSIEDATVIEQQ